jgi:hypothetical protein
MRILSPLAQRCFTCSILAILSAIPCQASGHAEKPATVKPVHVYHALIPLGSEVFSYTNNGEHRVFYVMASAQNREFDGQQVWVDGERHVLKTPNGVAVQAYPRQVSFRVSVSVRDSNLIADAPLPVETHGDNFNDFLKSMKFEMRIFHALTSRILAPTKIASIGVPADVPSDRRVYQVTFDLGNVPISDRVVMHVLSGEGERLAKFNLDLY